MHRHGGALPVLRGVGKGSECPVIGKLVCEAWGKPRVLGIAFTDKNEPLFLESNLRRWTQKGQARRLALGER